MAVLSLPKNFVPWLSRPGLARSGALDRFGRSAAYRVEAESLFCVRLAPRAAASALLLCALPLSADTLADVFARMDKAAAQFKGMTSGIRQTVHTAIVNDDSSESGVIKMKRDKGGGTLVLVEFTNPDRKVISLDGGMVRMFLPKANVVQVIDLTSRKALLEKALLLGFGAPTSEIAAEYNVSYLGPETIEGTPAAHLRLIPKSKEVLQNLKQAELWIADSNGSPVQQKFSTNAAGDYKLVTFSHVRLNPPLPDKDLRLSTPKGVQIQQVGK